MLDLKVKKKTMVEIAIVRVIVVICQLIFLKIYTHYTSLYELGIYIFLFTISYALNAFVLVPLDYFQQSKLYKLREEGYSLKSFYPINKLVLLFGLVILTISCLVCLFINPALCFLAWLIIFLAISTYMVNLLRGFINNFEHRRKAIYSLLFETVCKILFLLLYIHFFQSSAKIILWAMLSASLLSFTVLFLLVKMLDEYKLENKTTFILKDIFSFAFPISIGAVTNWIQLQSYSLVLVPLGFVEAVGIFGTIANVGSSGMNACSTVFSQLFVPTIYKSHGRYINTYLRNALLAIGFVLIFSTFASKIIIELLTKKDFAHYSMVIIYGILTEAGNFIISANIIYLTIYNLTKSTTKMSVAGLTVFFFSFILLYLFKNINVYTVGLPMALSQLAISTGLYILVYKNLKKHE
jgi:O-antigen/teichoic acid export membrane protein